MMNNIFSDTQSSGYKVYPSYISVYGLDGKYFMAVRATEQPEAQTIEVSEEQLIQLADRIQQQLGKNK